MRRVPILAAALALGAGVAFAGLARADTIVRGFNANGSLQPGWIVALSQSSASTVEPAPANDPSRIYGIVIDPAQAPATLQSQAGQKIFVATSGTYPVLVNTQNGTINPGDYVSISSTDGIGAKATNQQSNVLGQALEKFNGSSNLVSSGTSGLPIGRIEVTIIPGKNPLIANQIAIPAPLRRAGEAIAGKNISALRIYAALLVFIIMSFIAATLLWGGVRSGMISIGRNPLSKHSIIQGLVQVIIVAVLVFIIGVFAVYLLLKL
jgi:hypothetical protein